MRTRELGLVFCLLFVGLSAFGQASDAMITGTVTDPQGAVVVGAKVTVKNSATGVVSSTVTTDTGNYTIADLPPGTYIITVAKKGFKTYTHANSAVASAAIAKEDVALQVEGPRIPVIPIDRVGRVPKET
jgi:hypothetical protein